jgi:transcriptional regulator with XRE-family HTH domain
MPATASSVRRRISPSRAQAQDINRHVGARMRERRIMLRLTQQEMAELIGVTNQQVHKYEQGINRIAVGRLHQIAQALDVEVGYFFKGIKIERGFRPNPRQPRLLDLARNFIALPSRQHQEALCLLARALADVPTESIRRARR